MCLLLIVVCDMLEMLLLKATYMYLLTYLLTYHRTTSVKPTASQHATPRPQHEQNSSDENSTPTEELKIAYIFSATGSTALCDFDA